MKPLVKFNEKLNMDIATEERISKTNEKLVEYLKDSGEEIAVEQVEYLIKNQKKEKNADINENPVYEKLLITNKKILGVLSNIHRDMIDEQDTSIKSTSTIENEGQTNLLNMLMSSGGFGFDIPEIGFKSRKRGKSKVKKPRSKSKVKKPRSKSKVEKTSRANKKISGGSAINKTSSRVKGIGKVAKNLVRFAKVVPGLGLIVTAGMAIYDGVEGYDNASEILGIPEDELTLGNKITATASSIISGLTFGLVNSSNLAKGIQNISGSNEVINAVTKAGIIDHDLIGKSEIEDWDRFAQLPSNQIQDIIDIDDWSDVDLNHMKELFEASKLREEVLPSTLGKSVDSKIAVKFIEKLSDFKVQKNKDAKWLNNKQAAINAAKQIPEIQKTIKSLESQIIILKRRKAEALTPDDKIQLQNTIKQTTKTKDSLSKQLDMIKNNSSKYIKTQSSPNIGSGLQIDEPKKTSDIPTKKTSKDIIPEATVIETSRINKENIIDDSHKNLTKQVVIYESAKRSNTSPIQDMQAVIKTNINNMMTQNVGQEKILNIFS